MPHNTIDANVKNASNVMQQDIKPDDGTNMLTLDSVFDKQMLAESRQEAVDMFGIASEDADAAIEKSIVDSPSEKRILVLQENMSDPGKAEALSNGIDASSQKGLGIIPAAFAALAGAMTPGKGSQVANNLMNEWDPRTQEARRVNDEGAALQLEMNKRAFNKKEFGKDPNSEEAMRVRKSLQDELTQLGLPKFAALYEGQSIEQMEKTRKNMSERIKFEIGAPDRQIKADATAATRENTEAYRSATLSQAQRAQTEKERQTQVKEDQYQTPGEKKVDTVYAKDYNDWTTGGVETYNKNIKKLKSAATALRDSIKRGDALVSGNIAGRLPDFFRTTEGLTIQQDVQGAAQGALKATLGAAFTEKEGERIMNFSYDPALEQEENITKIEAAIEELVGLAKNQNSKAAYWEANNGTLDGWGGRSSGAETSKPNKVKVRSPDGKIGEIPANQVDEALTEGYTLI